MEIIKQNIKKHPYISVFIAWVFFFLTFGRFSTEGVLPINYISPIVFGASLIIIYLIYSEKTKSKTENLNKIYIRFILAVSVCVLYTLAAVYAFSKISYDRYIEGRNPLVPFVFVVTAMLVTSIFISIRKKWSFEKAAVIIFGLGFAVHLLFILSNLFWTQLDLGSVNSDWGHLGYIRQIYDNFIPAQFDPRQKWQFYHPPLHYYIEALFLRLQTLSGLNIITASYNLQYPTLLYFLFTFITSKKIAEEFNLTKIPQLIVLLIMAFSPAFVMVSNYMNNDMLSVLFIMLCILHSIRWYKNRTLKNIITIALCFGFGMLTKLSVWMAAIPIAVLFIAALIENLKSKEFKSFWKLFRQMCVFLCVAAPLALYWSLRNLIRFGVPIGFIPQSMEASNYIHVPIMQRLFDFNPHQFDITAVASHTRDFGYNEYNPLVALIKSSSSDICSAENFEKKFFHIDSIVLWIAIVLCTVSFVCMVYILIKKNTLPPVYKIMLSATYITILLSYYIFCIKYPDTCTEDIRYASPLIFIGAVFIALTVRQLQSFKGKISKILCTSIIVLTAAFCISSFTMFVCDSLHTLSIVW